MKNSMLLFLVFFFVGQSILLPITIDSDFLRNNYSRGGTLLLDSKGDLNYLWVERKLTEKGPYSGHQHPLSYKFKFKKTDLSGKILCNTKILGELGPYYVYLSTNGAFDSQGNLFGVWDLCVRSDVVSSLENMPCYALLSKISKSGKVTAEPCTVLPFNGDNFILTVDLADTVWGVGKLPSQILQLCFARFSPNPQKIHNHINRGVSLDENKREHRFGKTSTGRGAGHSGLRRKIYGFSANNKNQFILCERMSPETNKSFDNFLVSYTYDKKGEMLRDPIDFLIEKTALRTIPSSNLSNIDRLSLYDVFTRGTRLVNYGKDKIYAIVVYDENIYIVHLSEDGKPIKADKQKIVKPLKLPKEWKPSLRLWTYLTKDNTLFYIFGIDKEANFYWETVTVE